MPNHRQIVERSRARHDVARSKFTTWAIENGFGHVRNNDMPKALEGNAVGLDLLATERAAWNAKHDAENNAVSAGYAWRDTFGHAQLYTTQQLRGFKRSPRRTFGG